MRSARAIVESRRGDPWDRVQRAYRELLGDADPVGPLVAEFGVVDLRPVPLLGIPDPHDGPVVISGPDDLIELREAVERVTGPATWPLTASLDLEGPLRRSRIGLDRPSAPMALIVSLEPLLVDRGGAWRTAKTTREAIAAAVADLAHLTAQARIIDPRTAATMTPVAP